MSKIEGPPDLKRININKAIKLHEDYSNLIREVNEKYLYWDKVKYKEIPDSIKPEEIWQAAKMGRFGMNRQYLKFGNYDFVFNSTNHIQNALHHFDLNIGGNLGSKSVIQTMDKHYYLISSIMEEAIASSQIEGAVTTRKQAKEMLQKGRQPRTHSEKMIFNNYKTIQFILEIKDQPLTIERLKQVHRLITNSTLNNAQDEGNFRQTDDVNVVDVIDGEIVYSPPIHEELEKLLTELCTFFNNDTETFIHPIVKACIIHFMIGYIHPFVDGNGRTARALFYWYLLSKQYWLTEYLSISRMIIKTKQQYANAFIYTEKDGNDLTYFILYNIKVMSLAYEELKKYIQRKIEEKKQLVQFQKIADINERQALILKWIHEEPDLLLTAKEIQNRVLISNQTAQTDLTGLVKLGFLEILKQNRKTKSYHRSETFEILLKEKMK